MQSIPMEDIDILITDLGAPEKIIQEIKKKKAQIIFADLH